MTAGMVGYCSGETKLGVPREDAEKDDPVDLKVEKSRLTD